MTQQQYYRKMTQQQYDRNSKLIELARSGKFDQCRSILTRRNGKHKCHCYTGLVLEVYKQETGKQFIRKGFTQAEAYLPIELWRDFMGWHASYGPDIRGKHSLLSLNDGASLSFSQIADLHEKWLKEQKID